MKNPFMKPLPPWPLAIALFIAAMFSITMMIKGVDYNWPIARTIFIGIMPLFLLIPEIGMIRFIGDAIAESVNLKDTPERWWIAILQWIKAAIMPTILWTTLSGSFPWGPIMVAIFSWWFINAICSLGDPESPDERYYQTHDYRNRKNRRP